MAQKVFYLIKSLLFAARIVKLHKYLIREKHGGIILKQIISSEMSIGVDLCFYF